MWTKPVDAYNRENRRFAVRQGDVFVCYLITEIPGSEIMKKPVPQGTVASLDEAQRWVDGDDGLLMPPSDVADIPC